MELLNYCYGVYMVEKLTSCAKVNVCGPEGTMARIRKAAMRKRTSMLYYVTTTEHSRAIGRGFFQNFFTWDGAVHFDTASDRWIHLTFRRQGT